MAEVHANKDYSILQITMNLAGACFISGIIIALTYFFTAPVAAQKSELLKQQAMKALVTNADSFKPVPNKIDWFLAEKANKPIAYILLGESKGFGGSIKMLVAVTPDGKVIDYNILEHNETPGLGDNASKEPFRKQFVGKAANALKVVKDSDNTENIQAMTGATISSNAVTKGVKEAVEQVVQYTGGK